MKLLIINREIIQYNHIQLYLIIFPPFTLKKKKIKYLTKALNFSKNLSNFKLNLLSFNRLKII